MYDENNQMTPYNQGWTPDLHDPISRFFHDAALNWRRSIAPDPQQTTWTPAVDVLESADAYRLIAELPGYDAQHVTITYEDHQIVLRGNRPEVADESFQPLRMERMTGEFERRFVVPGAIDADNIEANFDHGVLTVTLHKSESARARQIPIQSN